MSGGFNNLNPVIEENERESAKNKNRAKENFENFVEGENIKQDHFSQERKLTDLNPCFSTPPKRNMSFLIYDLFN